MTTRIKIWCTTPQDVFYAVQSAGVWDMTKVKDIRIIQIMKNTNEFLLEVETYDEANE
jgi:hypothetical protein